MTTVLTLIVDDNPTNLLYLEALARRIPGNEVVGFEQPLAALDWCRTNVPDLVLLDYMMPEIDGLMLLREFRALPGRADIPVVIVTTENERSVRLRALEAGATDFLGKPVDPAEFGARTRNLLALRTSQKTLADRALHLASEVRRATADIAARELEVIVRLSRAAEYRDPETGAHIHRMAHLSALIATRLGLGSERAEMLLRAAPMHDIGKVGIPDSILLKPGRLTEDELAVMRRHPEVGWRILSGSAAPVVALAAEIALAHHERFDGMGYPNGVAGEAIPLEARIVAVADVFDALTSVRPYKAAWTMDDARDFLLAHSGSHFDPACVDAFLAAWDDAQAICERFPD